MEFKLDIDLNPEEFIHLYWTREELSVFCRQQHIPCSVSRRALMETVYNYLKEKESGVDMEQDMVL